VCDLETSWMRRPWPALGRSDTEKNIKLKKKPIFDYYIFHIFSWNDCSTKTNVGWNNLVRKITKTNLNSILNILSGLK